MKIKELGLEKGWNMRYITDLTDPVDFYLRGEEYSCTGRLFCQAHSEQKTLKISILLHQHLIPIK